MSHTKLFYAPSGKTYFFLLLCGAAAAIENYV